MHNAAMQLQALYLQLLLLLATAMKAATLLLLQVQLTQLSYYHGVHLRLTYLYPAACCI